MDAHRGGTGRRPDHVGQSDTATGGNGERGGEAEQALAPTGLPPTVLAAAAAAAAAAASDVGWGAVLHEGELPRRFGKPLRKRD
jgi:hypothetical protein